MAARPPRRILVPVDFSPSSAASLDWARVLAGPFEATIDVLHVFQSAAYAGAEHVVVPTLDAHGERPTLSEYAERQSATHLEEFLAGFRFEGNARVRGRAESGDPVTVILRMAPEYDLVVMGTHGRHGLGHVLLGSVAERIVRKATCPVLTIRA